VSGTFDDNKFAIDNDMETSAPSGPTMRIKAKTSGKRLGDCSEAEKKAAEAEAKAA
jgi:hypothetical protein